MKKTLLILLGLLIALPSIARDFTYTYEGQTLTYTVLNEAAKTCQTKAGSGPTAGNSVDGVLIIPEKASDGSNEFTVTIIGNRALYDCYGLTSVTIPNSVTTIGNYAFDGCSGLTSVTIPESVTSIGSGAFSACNRLISIEVETENTMFSSSNGVLFNKNQTELLQFPGGKKGSYTIPNSVTTIGASAFYNCDGLNSVTIPNSVTTIGASAFYNCDGLTSITIPNSVTTIGKSAFSYCSGLTSVTIPESVTTIGDYAFYNCSGLTSVTIGNSVTTIGDYAFYGCSGLTSVTIGNSVTTIGDYAFYGCRGLTSVTIPNSVTTIGKYAFSNCYSLKSINLMVAVPPEVVDPVEVCDNAVYANATLKIPQGSFEKYAGTIWNRFQNIEVGGVMTKAFNDGVFNYRLLPDAESPIAVLMPGDYSEMEEASIPERFTDDSDPDNPVRYTITAIGPDAFKDCSNLKIVNFNSRTKITAIAPYAFYGCSGLTSVTIPESVTTIGESAFNGCSGLTSVTIPNSVTSIGASAFLDCDGLTSVTIPNSVTTIGDEAFKSCNRLKSVTLGNSLSEINSNVFDGCNGRGYFRTLNITDGYGTLHIVGGNASWMSGIKELYLGRNVEGVKFPSVTRLEIGNQVEEIGESMFSGCTGLTEVALGNGLTTIGSNAFSGCSLTEVIVPPSVETIEASAFADNTSLATVTMGHKVASIGDMAYNGCPVDEVYITALTPPTAPNNTFSRYSGRLWVANAQAVEDYYNAYTCWDRFSAYSMIEPEEIKIEGAQTIEAAPGDTIRLTATISPDNVTLPQIFWRSTNPDIATVDNNGVVVVRGVEPEIHTYAQGDDYTAGGCCIIAESLYADAPIAMVAINSELADIEDIVIDRKESQAIDYAEPYDVYNMQGVWLGRSVDTVSPGFYILRQGSKAAKILK